MAKIGNFQGTAQPPAYFFFLYPVNTPSAERMNKATLLREILPVA
jgi:hypothetical protein